MCGSLSQLLPNCLYLVFFLQDPVDPGEACPGPNGVITHYHIRFQGGRIVNTDNANTARCSAGRCKYIFKPPSNPPSNYDSVSVAAANVVGVGAARTCTAQTISELHKNNIAFYTKQT